MPNIDELMDGMSQIIAKRKDGEVYFITLNFMCAHGQVAIEAKANKQCNFSLVG